MLDPINQMIISYQIARDTIKETLKSLEVSKATEIERTELVQEHHDYTQFILSLKVLATQAKSIQNQDESKRLTIVEFIEENSSEIDKAFKDATIDGIEPLSLQAYTEHIYKNEDIFGKDYALVWYR